MIARLCGGASGSRYAQRAGVRPASFVGLARLLAAALIIYAAPSLLTARGGAGRPSAALNGQPQGKSRHQARRVSGLVVSVEADRITLQPKDGPIMTLTALEDYRDRLAIGSQVTAWYYPQDNGEAVLKSIDLPPESLLLPASEIERRVHKVILLPNSQVADADALYDAVRDYVHTRLGWYVAPSFLAQEIRRRAAGAGSTLDAMDPRTGRFDLARYAATSESMVKAMAAGSRSDGVLQVDVLQVEAPVSRLVASWDGVEEPVAGAGVRTLAKFSFLPHKGHVPAATVELKLWDANGNLLWRNRRGLALLEVLKGNHLRERPLPEFLGDSQAVQAWLNAAFKPILPDGTLGALEGE